MTFDPASGTANAAGVKRVDPGAYLYQNQFWDVACPSTAQCTAVDNDGNEVTFNPASGSVNSAGVKLIDPAGNITVACASSTQCTAVDQSGNEVTFDPASPGSPPVVAVDPGQQLHSVACASGSQCTAVDASGHEVTFDPTSGSVNGAGVKSVDRGQGLDSVACASTTQCTALQFGSSGNEVTFDPTSGSVNAAGLTSVDPTGSNLFSVACASSTQCTAVDNGGNEVTFDPTNPGSPSPVAIDPTSGLNSVACPSGTQCTASDAGGNEVTFNPTSGSLNAAGVKSVDPRGQLSSVACPSSTQCTAVDQSGNEVTFDPTMGTDNAFGVTSIGLYGGNPTSVACSSPSQCTAVGTTDGGSEATFDPASPGSPSPVDIEGNINGGINPSSVACPSSTQCTAVGYGGNEVTFNPTNPGSPSPVAIDSNGLSSVACPSGTQCTAVDIGGNEVTFDPASGSVNSAGVKSLDSAGNITVACPSTTQCTAVDQSGNEVTFNPASGSVTAAGVKSVDPRQGLDSVACPSSTQCTAVANDGYEVTFDPAAPGSPSPGAIAGSNALRAIACSSVSECVAVDDDGNAFVGFLRFPSLSVSAPSSGTAGAVISASSISATLSGGGSPSGTITFEVFGPQSSAPSACSGGRTVGTATVSGNATYHPSAGFTPPSAGDYWWYASYGGDAGDNPANSACGASMTETVVAPAPPTGAVSSASAGSSTPGGSATATNAGTTVTGAGEGALTVSQYGSDPVGQPSFSSAGEYFDVQVASGSSFSSLTITDCRLGGGTSLQWWDGSAWEAVSPQSYSPGSPACVTAALGSSSAPTIAQLTGTVFAVVSLPARVAPAISGLKVAPRTFSLAGRKVNGKCVEPTKKNRRHPHCRRAIKLRVSYTLNAAATVTLTIKLKGTGRKVNGKCVKQTRKNKHKHKPKCTLHKQLKGKITEAGKAGANTFTFNGKIGGHKLGPGAYQLIATPAGGKPQTVNVKLVP